MSDTLIVLHTAIAIIAIVVLIVVVKVDPVPSLVIGTLYLGVAAGLGFGDTIGTLVQGFADIMAEVGLLIGFGVLMGMLLTTMGALQKLVELLLRILGPRRLPYAFSAAIDRKSTRLNSSHANISYAVFCLKKKKTINT